MIPAFYPPYTHIIWEILVIRQNLEGIIRVNSIGACISAGFNLHQWSHLPEQEDLGTLTRGLMSVKRQLDREEGPDNWKASCHERCLYLTLWLTWNHPRNLWKNTIFSVFLPVFNTFDLCCKLLPEGYFLF